MSKSSEEEKIAQVGGGLLNGSAKTPNDDGSTEEDIRLNEEEDSIKGAAVPQAAGGCQARAALFVSPPYHLGKTSSKISNAAEETFASEMASACPSQGMATNSSSGQLGGGNSSSGTPFSARDGQHGAAACSNGLWESAGGKYNKRGRSQGFHHESDTGNRRGRGTTMVTMKVSHWSLHTVRARESRSRHVQKSEM
jgi:hypothetical protein